MSLGLHKRLAAAMAIAATAALTGLPAKADPYNWTGPYLGLSIGGLFGNTDYSFGATSGGAPSGSSSDNGVVGGIYGGYQYQFHPLPVVLGLEGDFQGSSASGSFSNSSGASSQGSSSLGWQSSIRGRVGYAMDRFLPYVTGGVEFGHFNFGGGPLNLGGPNLPICCNFSSTLTGWTVGAGVDYALTDSIILRAEYRYEDFGNFTSNLAPDFPNVPMTVSPTANMVTIGAAWHF